MRRTASLTLLLCAWTTSSIAQAQPNEVEASDEEPIEVEALEVDVLDEEAPPEPAPLEVRVTGTRADELQKIPGSVTLITAPEIRKARPANVGEMLRRVPGVLVRQEEGAGLRLDIGIRGLDPGRARRVLVLEDGVPVAINPYAEADLYYQPPVERMRGIEVVKGSGSILFGPQTVGGVINFITVAPPWEQTASVDTQIGQRGFFKVAAAYGDRYETARYLVQAFYKRGDGFREQGFEAVDVFSKVAFETSETGELTVKVGVHDVRADSDDVGLTRGMYAQDPRRPTLSPNSRSHLQRYEVSTIHEHAFTPEVKLRTLAYAYTTDRVWTRQNHTRVPAAGGTYDRIVGDTGLPLGAIYFEPSTRVLDRIYRVAGIEPRWQVDFDTLGIGHTIDFGARLLGEGAHLVQRQGETATSDAGSVDLDETHRTIAVAGYVQDRIAFLDELLVTPGVRIEHAQFEREIDRLPTATGAQDVAIRGENDVTAVVPGIGMTVGVPRAHAFAGMHSGFAPPRIVAAINPNGTAVELEAERSIMYELGTRLRPEKWQRLEVTGFLSNFFNQIVPATRPGAPTELVNGGSTQHYGVEAASQTKLGRALSLPIELDVTARYGFLQARFVGGDFDGNLLPYAPQHTASGVLDVAHEDTGLSSQVSVSYVGDHFADDANTGAEDVTGRIGRIDGYAVLDLGARYRHALTGLSTYVTVKNALDDVYVASRRPEGIFASGFRQVNVGLRWDTP